MTHLYHRQYVYIYNSGCESDIYLASQFQHNIYGFTAEGRFGQVTLNSKITFQTSCQKKIISVYLCSDQFKFSLSSKQEYYLLFIQKKILFLFFIKYRFRQKKNRQKETCGNEKKRRNVQLLYKLDGRAKYTGQTVGIKKNGLDN